MFLMLHWVVGPRICKRLHRLSIRINGNIDNYSRHKSFVQLFGLGGPWREAGWRSGSSLEQNPLLKDAACKEGGNFDFSGAIESCDVDEIETSALIGRRRCPSIHFLHFLPWKYPFLAGAWRMSTIKTARPDSGRSEAIISGNKVIICLQACCRCVLHTPESFFTHCSAQRSDLHHCQTQSVDWQDWLSKIRPQV